jgi:hypothetical protein
MCLCTGMHGPARFLLLCLAFLAPSHAPRKHESWHKYISKSRKFPSGDPIWGDLRRQQHVYLMDGYFWKVHVYGCFSQARPAVEFFGLIIWIICLIFYRDSQNIRVFVTVAVGYGYGYGYGFFWVMRGLMLHTMVTHIHRCTLSKCHLSCMTHDLDISFTCTSTCARSKSIQQCSHF